MNLAKTGKLALYTMAGIGTVATGRAAAHATRIAAGVVARHPVGAVGLAVLGGIGHVARNPAVRKAVGGAAMAGILAARNPVVRNAVSSAIKASANASKKRALVRGRYTRKMANRVIRNNSLAGKRAAMSKGQKIWG